MSVYVDAVLCFILEKLLFDLLKGAVLNYILYTI